MAAGDFLDLQTNLAKLAGRPTAADLDDDLALCKQVINEAYLGCYLTPDGVRPSWARQTFGLLFRAPVTATLGVTNGSRVVTGHTFNADQVGSTVAIGTNRYTYAGLNGSNQELVEPVSEATGSVTATIYHESQPLAARTVDLIGDPERKGYGLLSPMTNRETEIRYRSNRQNDYRPERGTGYYGSSRPAFGGVNFETGDPLFFRIESGGMIATAAIQDRLCLYPVPDAVCTIRFDANIIPTELSADADRPLLKGDLVTRILLPIARAKWAASFKKFAAEPATLQGIAQAGAAAESMLRTIAQPQRRFSGRSIAVC